MRTLTGLLFAIIMNPVFSYSETTYEKAMEDALNMLNQATNIDDFRGRPINLTVLEILKRINGFRSIMQPMQK